jgi:hypothetical protein
MTQTLLPKVLKAKAWEYYQANKLIAQHPELQPTLVYRVGDYRCAVGAALDDATIALVGDKDGGAISDGFVYAKPSHRQAIERIQNAHDMWAQDRLPKQEANFVKLIKPRKQRL